MSTRIGKRVSVFVVAGALLGALPVAIAATGRPLRVLFLGDRGHHKPSARYAQFAPPMKRRGIRVTYTGNMNDLNPATLKAYDVLMVYANINTISSSQERAVLDYVAAGGGFAPIHCASFCFRNSEAMVKLTGAQFKRHGAGVFRPQIVEANHPVMKGFAGFESWDETYVHAKHNEQDRTVLSYRKEGAGREPWTWVRSHGRGRVFYTAWGHDHRTWGNPGFQELLARGLAWAAGDAATAALKAHAAALSAARAERTPLRFEPRPTVQNYEKRAPYPQFQLPLPARDSMAYIALESGFELELFASEPDIVNPIAFTWDHRGRLWIVETVDYPNTFTDPGKGHDRIKICEDTDGDGRADQFSVFAEGLNIPTGIVLANGGVIVSQAPNFIFFKDTNGDDKADTRETIITGWGKGDTHAGPSNLTYGLDNWIYGAVGYSGFNGTVGGVKAGFRSGIYRFARDSKTIEFLTQYSNNTWGLGISETGEIFGSTANNTHHMYTAIPNRYFSQTGMFDPRRGRGSSGGKKIDAHYPAHPATPKIRQVDVFGGYTAAAGHKIYTARAFPRKYWNRAALVCEPTMHLLHQGFLKRDGSGWTEEGDGRNLLASEDEWVAPVYAETGPDGAVWVADWYNFIIQHNPTPRKSRGGFDTTRGRGNAHVNALRDKTHGRIYRIVYTGAKNRPARKRLDPNNPRELVAALADDNMFWRLTAQRLLVKRGKIDVAAQLVAHVMDQRVDAVGINGGAIHALWTLHGLGLMDGKHAFAKTAAAMALVHPSPGVRRNAALVQPRTEEGAIALAESGILTDADSNVQLAALLAASEMPSDEGIGRVLYALSKNKAVAADPWLPKALRIAVTKHGTGFLIAALSGGEKRAMPKGQGAEAKIPTKNLFKNANFEKSGGKMASNWAVRHYGGQAKHEYVKEGRNGGYCIKITSPGADTSVNQAVTLRPKTNYRLTAWVMTEGVSGAMGALLNIHEMGKNGRTKGIKGSKKWTKVQSKFNSGNNRRVTINLLFGGWGKSKGTAWYDDVELVQVGKAGAPPIGETQDLVAIAAQALAKRGAPEDRRIVLAAMGNADMGLVMTIQKALAAGSTAARPKGPQTLNTAGADVVITIKTVPEKMQYDIKRFQVKAGQKVALVLENPDQMPHNILVCKPGSLQRVGAAADAMLTDPKAADRDYVPKSKDILAASRLVAPNDKVVIRFTAPKRTGDYPYLCTFPGHWRIMNGVMEVTR